MHTGLSVDRFNLPRGIFIYIMYLYMYGNFLPAAWISMHAKNDSNTNLKIWMQNACMHACIMIIDQCILWVDFCENQGYGTNKKILTLSVDCRLWRRLSTTMIVYLWYIQGCFYYTPLGIFMVAIPGPT